MDECREIDVGKVLAEVCLHAKFPSVDEIYEVIASLNNDERFSISIAGYSRKGAPLHHIKFGKGRVKVLFLGYPHVDEPIGGLTIISLISLLRNGCKELVEKDVEWNIIPCIDPDGVRLNEGWFEPPFSLKKFMRNFHKQNSKDQVDGGFPIQYKNLLLNAPASIEVEALAGVINDVKPDFFFSLHNAMIGGGYFYLNHDIDDKYKKNLISLLVDYGVHAQINPTVDTKIYGDSVFKLLGCRGWYDLFELHTDDPSNYIHGATSYEYLESIAPGATTFLAEVPYMSYAGMGSEELTNDNLKQLMLRADTECKYIKSIILQEWGEVKHEVNTASPFFQKVHPHIEHGLVALHEALSEFPLNTTQSILQNSALNRVATIAEKFKVCVRIPYAVLCHNYAFLRLLKDSVQSPNIESVINRLEFVFEKALEDILTHIDPQDLSDLDINKLVKVQLGSGLTVLNSVLANKTSPSNQIVQCECSAE